VLLNAPRHIKDMMDLGAGETSLLNLKCKATRGGIANIFLVTLRIVEFLGLGFRKKNLAFIMMGLIVIFKPRG
jgi:hypothetical protein